MKQSKVLFVALTALAVLATGALAVAVIAAVPADYKGKPWKDTPQVIPGKVWAAYYDVGGDGVAYHDKDTKNHGSGELNRGPEEKNNFRKDEGISISYTKAAFDKWKDTARSSTSTSTTSAGPRRASRLTTPSTSRRPARTSSTSRPRPTTPAPRSAIGVNGAKAGPINITQTGYWHAWLMHNNIAELKLDKGLNVITFKYVKEGNMNVMWLEFVPKGAETTKPAAKEAPKDAPK